MWKFLRKKAFTRWHKTFEAMEEAVSGVLDHLEEYRAELTTLMTRRFQLHPAPGGKPQEQQRREL